MGVRLDELAKVQAVPRLSAMCHGKQAFADKAAGLAVMRRMTGYAKFRGLTGINVYRCVNCRSWHIGAKSGAP